MLKTVAITIALIGLLCAVPALAQSQNEEGKLNFSLGGGFTIPMNPIARFAGVGGSFLLAADLISTSTTPLWANSCGMGFLLRSEPLRN